MIDNKYKIILLSKIKELESSFELIFDIMMPHEIKFISTEKNNSLMYIEMTFLSTYTEIRLELLNALISKNLLKFSIKKEEF